VSALVRAKRASKALDRKNANVTLAIYPHEFEK
jgi:hypothetical protein